MYAVMSRLAEYSANIPGFICYLLGLVLAAVVFYILVIPVHNVIKYRVVVLCGDEVMAKSRYNTMSPIVNFFGIGFVSTLVLGMGFGRPVYFDMHDFRRPGIHTCFVAFTGLAVYFVSYILFFLVFTFLKFLSIFSIEDYHVLPVDGQWYVYAYYILFVMFAFLRMYCIFSFIFNLIPFGPMDMADVLYMFLPVNWSDALRNNQSIASFLLVFFAIISFGRPTSFIPNMANNLNHVFNTLIERIF
ncbi:MAG: hypothetical protein II225_03675 [Ruminococcus sp.]|nr:hypothetical protein [Ruminococcus sp.]